MAGPRSCVLPSFYGSLGYGPALTLTVFSLPKDALGTLYASNLMGHFYPEVCHGEGQKEDR